jgi:thiosulfate/3-mercaptopyruvate sulfurtransferase
MRPIVDLAFVKERRSEIVLADVRWYVDGRSGEAAYKQGHLPEAVFVDLERWLSAEPSAQAGRHPLPDPEVFATGMSELGIGDVDAVVAYDDEGGVTAARLVWMLRAIGHDAALLDGGMRSYTGPLERVALLRPRAVFTPRAWPAERLAGVQDALDARNVVIDARNRDRYRGEHEPLDPRAGHIPGAYNVPSRENLDSLGRLLPVGELRRRFLAVGVSGEAEVVSYCGSGITACHNLLAIEHAGLGVGKLYPGSWSQYSQAPEKLVVTGAEPE